MRFLLERFSLQLPEPTARTFRSALAIAAIAVVVAIVMAWRALPKSEVQEVVPAGGEVAVSKESIEFFDEAGSEISITDIEISQPSTIFVHVIGQVAKPGVVEVPFGSRVVVALEKAGGLTTNHKLEDVNLARVLSDGEQVYFGPRPAVKKARGTPAAEAVNPIKPISPANPVNSVKDSSSLINLNSATAADLELLPGVGPVLAKRILDFRKTHGGFLNVEGLLEVKGIGAKTFKEILKYVTV